MIEDAGIRAAALVRVHRSLRVDPETGCWNWTGATNHGYGVVNVAVGSGKRPQFKVHRLAYELMVGPIPEGLTIDHLCRNRGCANPEHLEPVTITENVQRAIRAISHCKHGHQFDEGNTSYRQTADGYVRRICKACARIKALAAYHAKKKVYKNPGGRSGPPTKTHCVRGHPLTEENIIRHGRGRHCKPCARERYRERSAQ